MMDTAKLQTHVGNIRALCERYGVRTAPLDLFEAMTMADARVQEPEGHPGTAVSGGDLYVEPNPLWAPFKVRGSWGTPGEYERIWRSEPKVYDAVQSYTETLITGQWSIALPQEASEELKKMLGEWMQAKMRELKSIKSGWTKWVEHAMTMAIFGFAPSEVIWGFDEQGLRYIYDLQYREVSTVDRWLFDQALSKVIGAQYRPYTGMSYTLYMGDDGPGGVELDEDERYRMIVCNLNAHGLNIEGVPPIRPALFYITLKQLIAQIVGVSAEVYGVPWTYIFEDPAAMAAYEGQADAQEAADLFNAIKNAQAVEGLKLVLPGALRLGQTAQTGTMPNFKEVWDYCDLQISAPFSNEGSLLGLQGSVGSYALGEVKERDTLNSAPYYARKLAEPINELLRLMCIEQFGELEVYPELTWSAELVENATQWLNDATALFGPNVYTWPEEAQRRALRLLNLQDNIIAKMQLLRPQAPQPAPQSPAPMHEHHHHELADAVDVVEDERAAAMDEVEAQLTAAFAKLQRELQAAWRVAVRDNQTPEDVLADREALRAEFLPRYVEAVRAALDAARTAGQVSLVSELGLEISNNELLLDLSKELQLLTVSVSEEAFNRILGLMTQASVGQAGGDRRRSVPLLAPSTLAKIASRPVSTAFNAGREDVAAELAAQVGKLTATYSSVLDRKTCKVCKELDGREVEYGSQTYRDLSPPHKCLGGERCRCIWIYSSPALPSRVGVIK